AAASTSTASRCATPRTGRGRWVSRCSSASPSDGAGSVETMSVGRPARAASSPIAAAHVVLPTPPLPPTNLNVGLRDGRRSAVLVAFERGIDAGDLVVGGGERGRIGALPAFAELPPALEQVGLEAVELGLAHLAELETHPGGQQ